MGRLPSGDAGQAVVTGQVVAIEHAREAGPGGLVSDREGEPPAIAAAVDPLRGTAPVTVTEALRRDSELQPDENVAELGDDILALGELHHLATARGVAVVEGGEGGESPDKTGDT